MKRYAIRLSAVVAVVASSGSIVTAQSWPLKGIYGYGSTYTQWSKKAGTQLFANTQVLNNSNVDGIAVKVGWSFIESVNGVYSWAELDSVIAQVAAVSKTVTLNVVPGYQTPSWLFSEGAQGFNFVWDEPWGPKLCSIVTIPLPWDPVFLAKWNAFIQAMGARYNSNPTVVGVKISGVNSKDEETMLPYGVNESISSGKTKCTGYDDVTDWQAIGYTRLQVESAWRQIAANYAVSFPSKALVATMDVGGFPPIDDNGTIFVGLQPAVGQDQQATLDIIAMGVTDYGQRFGLQFDGLISWGSGWSTENSYAGQIITGYQTASAMGSKLPSALTIATGAKTDYLELYSSDLTSSSLQSAIATARGQLQ
ncbi:MAG TPA: hypothetical protein VKS22_07680 [Candidatus Binataceae bacterium]|nr:hypothetical protein [Candidatus Binataceae bacterium]